jgi:hypothetical protein
MEIVEIFVEYPSGMTITDRASFSRDADQVYPSERLQALLREFSITEAPPAVSAVIDAVTVQLDSRTDGSFSVGEAMRSSRPGSAFARLLLLFSQPTKDQRQQFGRFCHTIAAAAFLGAVGVWHSTQIWTVESVKLEASLILGFVITFVRGMHSFRGE